MAQLEVHGSNRFPAEVGVPIELVVILTDAGVGVGGQPVSFTCDIANAFLFTQGGAEGVVHTAADGHARCQVTALKAAAGQSYQIRARFRGAGGDLDVWFSVNVAGDATDDADDPGAIEIPILTERSARPARPPRIVFRRITL